MLASGFFGRRVTPNYGCHGGQSTGLSDHHVLRPDLNGQCAYRSVTTESGDEVRVTRTSSGTPLGTTPEDCRRRDNSSTRIVVAAKSNSGTEEVSAIVEVERCGRRRGLPHRSARSVHDCCPAIRPKVSYGDPPSVVPSTAHVGRAAGVPLVHVSFSPALADGQCRRLLSRKRENRGTSENRKEHYKRSRLHSRDHDVFPFCVQRTSDACSYSVMNRHAPKAGRSCQAEFRSSDFRALSG